MSNVNVLREYDKLYYESGGSSVSDEYYDSLKNTIRNKYPDDPYFQEVGHPTKDKVKLPYILGSLNKVKKNNVDKWISDHPGEYIISQKMDGVSILVIYENGRVQKAYTRGNGEYGRDITNKASIFCPQIKNDSIIVLRGEAMLIGDVYKTLEFSTARNGVAGILNRDNDDDVRHITPYFYECIKFDELNMYTEYERFVLIESLELNTPKWKLLERYNVEEILSLNAEKCEYETDGVVISLNGSDRENTKWPDNKVAFKLRGESVQSKVIDVKWNVSRNGRVVPIVVIEPTEIGGVTVNKTTGFNAEFIENNGIGEGAIIELVRSGDVIPYITDVIEQCDEISIQVKCPSCGSYLERSGVDLICSNRFGCTDRSIKSVEYFLRTLGAENITAKTLDKLNIWDIESAYKVTDIDIMDHEGFGLRSAQTIIEEVKGTLSTTQDKLLQAFGIRGVGSIISKSLLNCFGSIDYILDSTENELMGCEGIGPKIAKNIVEESSNCFMLYKYLLSIGLKFTKDKEDNMLEGKVFALTGKGPMGRKDLADMIASQGGEVKGMSKTVDYLVTSDMDSKSGKMKMAREYSIPVISYEELMEMIGGDV